MTPCDIWTGATDDRGYGRTTRNGKPILVHRLAWIQAFGPIPRGKLVHHRCENPSCRNVDHLELMTKQQHQQHHNSRESCARCGGTEFYYAKGVKNSCKQCQKQRARDRYHRLREAA